MGFETPLVIIPFILVALTALILTGEAWRRGRSPGSLTFGLLMVAIIIWLVSAVYEELSLTVSGKVLWSKLGYLGIAWVGTLWFAFVRDYLYPEHPLPRRYAVLLSVTPLITIALVQSNELHSLVWSNILPYGMAQRLYLVYEHGPGFWLFAVYSYLLLAMGTRLLLHGIARFSGLRRRQAIGLLVGMLPPFLINLVYLVGWAPRPGLDLTPFGFILTGIIYSWIMFGQGLFDLAPLAHETILANTGEGYLVLDDQNCIMEGNRPARRFLGLENENIIGCPASNTLAHWPVLLDLFNLPANTQVELMTRENPVRYLEARLTDWFQRGDQNAGRILILQDITRSHLAEVGLRDSERLYKLLVNASPVGIALTDENGRITYASPQLYQTYRAPENYPVLNRSVLEWVHPDDRPIAIMRVLKTIEDKESLPPNVYRLLRVDGEMFWGEITSAPILDDSGASKGMLSILRDVTSRMKLELRLKQNLDQQTFINNLLQVLYRPKDPDAAFADVLEKTGLFMEASRVYLCQDTPDGKETSIVMEWCNPEAQTRSREGLLFRYAFVPSWRVWMEARGMVRVPEHMSVPHDIAEYMATWNTLSMAVFPIYGSEEQQYGFLGFDYCERARDWTDEELDLLWSVCRIISGAVVQRQVEEAEHRQRSLAEALHDTASALNGTLNFDEVLDRILANLEKLTQHDSASIALVDDENTVHFVRWRGYDAAGENLMRTLLIPLNSRETYRWMAETGEPVIISDTWLDKRWLRTSAYSWIRSYAGVPIQTKGKTVGFINLDSAKPDFFTLDMAQSLHIFAEQASVAIENARLYDEVHHRAEEMTILNRIGLTLTAGLEMNQVMISLLEMCRQVLPIDVFYVALYDAETGEITLPLFYNDGQEISVAPRNIKSEPGTTGEVINQRRTIYLPDTLDPNTAQTYHVSRLGGRLARSYVGVPLTVLNQVVGVISIQNFQPYAYSAEQIRLLETIATQAAIAVQNAHLYNQMKQMAITDSVTQLFTRRHFTALGRGEVERALRYNRALSVLMVDIDHFKRVNDTYGHNAGDQVLQGVAGTCCKVLRVTDIVGRWGGEEFAIVLPEADKEGAALIAERIRRVMAETEILMTQGTVTVTVSIGVALLNQKDCTLESLIDCADRALYMAKQAGRNQVKFLEDEDYSTSRHSGSPDAPGNIQANR